jgi:hypothetical protein
VVINMHVNPVRRIWPSHHFAIAAIFSLVLFSLALPRACWAWGPDGHQITAYIAADHLNASARGHIAQILGVDDNPSAVARAMAKAAVRPDAEFRSSAPETLEWHWINLCRQDTPADVKARCPNGNCVVARINRFVHDLRTGQKDGNWDSAAQLAFVINLMGEIHQPMHAITNADMGGKCAGIISPLPVTALHALWGEGMVTYVEHELHTHGPAETAAALQKRYPNPGSILPSATSIAWDSHELAESHVYKALAIPLQPCQPTSCAKPKVVTISRAYIERQWKVVAERLSLGGYHLAALLNTIWTD